MRRLVLLTPVVALGCIVPYYPPVNTDDSDSTDASVTDGDTDDTDDTTGGTDTGITDTSLTPTDDGPSDTDIAAGNYGCHNYDPVESSGWIRKYTLRTAGGTGVEKQTGMGLQTMPAGTAAAFPDGFAYEVVITGLPALNSTSTYFNRCGVQGDDGAFEVGFSQVNTTKPTFPLKAGAQTARKYLPDEVLMRGVFGANPWHVDMKYDMKVPAFKVFPTQGWAYDSAKLTYVGDVAPIGFETINVPALGGNVEAYHVNYTYTMEQKATSGGFFDIFNQLFAPLTSLFGFQGDDLSVSAVADQWYVRGVGLVKESVYRYPASTQELIREKTMTQCSGLPQCP